MKVTFLLNLDLEHKAGLFNAIHSRMKIQKEQFECEFYNLITIDSIPLIVLKKILRKENINRNILDNEVNIDGINYRNLYYKNSIINKIFDFLKIDYFKYKTILKKMKKDIKASDKLVVHFGYPHGRVSYYVKKIFKIDYVVYYHGSDIHTFLAKNETNKKIMFEIMEEAKANIFVSKALKNFVIQSGYLKNNLYSTCNGIDTDIFYMNNKIERNSNKKIGFIGNLEYIKRADMLPIIFENIKENISDAELIVIGDGSLKEYVKDRCSELNLLVKFTGRLNQIDIARELNYIDILILPSRKEAWGCVILEANACGVYCIGSDTGGLVESIGNYGTLVKNNDETVSKDIVNSILHITEKGIDRRKLSLRAKKFSWQIICDKEYRFINE